MAKLKDTIIDGNLVVNGNVAGDLEVDGNLESTGVINAVNFDGVFVEGLRFYNNDTVTLNCDSRGVVKVYLTYNGLSDYVDDVVYINNGTVGVVHNGTATEHLIYTFESENKLLTIQSPKTWSYGFAIGTRFFV